MFNSHKRQREQEKRDYARTQKAQSYMPGHDNVVTSTNKRRNGPTSKWAYLLPTLMIGIGVPIALVLVIQYVAYYLNTLQYTVRNQKPPSTISYFTSYHLGMVYFLILALGMSILIPYCHKKFHAIWFNNNAMFLNDDMPEYEDDAYVRSMDNLTQELDAAPDAGLGFNGHVSSIMSHAMMTNKGIHTINMPQYDPNVDGYVKRDENGHIVKKMVPMFDSEFADKLFSMSAVPVQFRTLFDATDYDFNRKLTRKEGGGKDEKGHYKRAGAYGRKEYDKLSDYINHEFYPIDTDTQRPAGVYFYDSRPVNTILIAITRGGKGQTYIEPAIDLWSREKHPWNLFSTDPKGELLAKFYYPLTARGFEIVQFNLMHPNLTDVYNPLINALQKFRENDPTSGSSLVDELVDQLWPNDKGEIWNPAAGNMFRRMVYLLFYHFINREKYIRYLGFKNNVPQDVIDREVDKNYKGITLYNVYVLIGELVSKISTDIKLINIDPSQPPAQKKDLLTLAFDAMQMLPRNEVSNKAITANNAIKPIASADQTIAGIYATLLTSLSVYDDNTAIALMSGSLSNSFDTAGLGFPRRVSINLDPGYVKKFRLIGEMFHWSIYRDAQFTDRYEGKDYEHEGRVDDTNWIWGFFKGIIDRDVAYLKLEIESGGTIAKTFYFKFVKGYKRFDDITYVTNPVTHKKMVDGGTLIELDGTTGKTQREMFKVKELDILQNSYHYVSKPIIIANQVFYSEQPKAIFAVTPPHLQVYQKHILLIISQILNKQYSMSYVTKSNRKPIVGTRLMLEEFGNIRSGKKGIPNLDTATSIALGQDVQITFVLQSFQQMREIYGEAVEKVIRANAANIIFLKSNDKELVDELVRLSGTRHKLQQKGKSVSRKLGDMVTVSEPVINYNSDYSETTALTANDLLFLAGQSPGNAITFSSGEMPIVNKLANIVPMAAGLHTKLPEPVGGQYSDATMPTIVTGDNSNYLDNIINGENLTKELVAQAKIWNEQLKPRIDELAKKEHVEFKGDELSDLVSNMIFELYDKQVGQSRENLAEPEPYWQKALNMKDLILNISNTKLDQDTRLAAIKTLKEELVKCILDPNLNDLTKIYKDTQPTTDINVGFDQQAVSDFVVAFMHQYPKPADLQLEHRDIDYHKFDAEKDNKPFEFMNEIDKGALNDYLEDAMTGKVDIVSGLDVKHEKGSKSYKVLLNGKSLWKAESAKPDASDSRFITVKFAETEQMEKEIANNAALMSQLQIYINDSDN